MLGVVVILSWRWCYLYQDAQDRYLKVSIQSSVSGQAQLYYDRGYGFNEHDSVVMHIEKSKPKFWGISLLPETWSGRPCRHYLFQLIPPVIYALRFDPVSSSTMHIKNMEIVNGLEHHLLAIELQQLQPVKQIKVFNISKQEVTLITEEEGDPQIHIMLDSPLMLEQTQPGLWPGLLSTILIQTAVVILVVVLILMIKEILPSDKLKFYTQNLSWLLDHLMHSHVILIFITALFLWFYGALITRLFPVFFEKFFFCTVLILISRYILTREEKDKNINALIYAMFLYLLLVVISVFMHYYAINSSELDYIDFTSVYYKADPAGQAALFDKYRGIKTLSDNAWNADQSAFMWYFPFLFLVSIALFRSTAHGWKMLTWIPLLFVPNLLLAIYQYSGLHYISNATAFIESSKFLLRLLLFLIFPLTIFGGIIVKHWWNKVLYVLVMIVILWLVRLSAGRNTMLGILLFIVLIPIIRLWVHRFQNTVRKHVYIGLALMFNLAIITGFAFPKYHGIMSKIFTWEMVKTSYTLIRGDLEGSLGGRSERVRTAWKLIGSAPVSGWGPGAFQKNANRIRFINGDRASVAHAMPNFYLMMAANFGFVGLGVILFIHLMPLWMIIRIRKQIQNHEERWAVGIAFAAVCIMLLISTTNPNFSMPTVNWIYSLYLGFLVSMAIKHGYTHYPIKSWLWGIGTLFLLIFFIAGTYSTTFGAHGYRAIHEDLISRITSGYHSVEQVMIWDNKKMTGTFNVSNRLIKTRANPFRRKYTTNVFSMKAISRSISMQAPSNLFCIKTSVEQQSNQSSFYITLQVFLDDKKISPSPHIFQMEGEKMLYYYVPNIENKEVGIKVKVDMWRAILYHEDGRTEIEQKYMPDHPDYGDFAVIVSVIPFEKTVSAT